MFGYFGNIVVMSNFKCYNECFEGNLEINLCWVRIVCDLDVLLFKKWNLSLLFVNLLGFVLLSYNRNWYVGYGFFWKFY